MNGEDVALLSEKLPVFVQLLNYSILIISVKSEMGVVIELLYNNINMILCFCA